MGLPLLAPLAFVHKGRPRQIFESRVQIGAGVGPEGDPLRRAGLAQD